MRFFNQFQLQTPESVELEFTLAGIGNRTLALLIDYLFLAFSIGLFWVCYVFLIVPIGEVIGNLIPDADVEMWLLAIASLITFFVYVGYFVIFESLWQGQTPGKRFTRIRVIQDNGRRSGIGQAVLRSLLRPVDDLFFIGVFMIMLGRQEKRIGDWVAGTIVIQEERSIAPADFPISDAASRLALKLQQEADINQLLPEEFATIREYLQRRPHLTTKAKTRLSQQLAQQIQALIHLETQPNAPDTFLEAVYLAYQNLDNHHS